MVEEIHITITTYHGVQVSLESLRNDRWRSLSFGISESLIDVVYGTASDEDVDDHMRELASYWNEEPARHAAGHMDHSRKLFEYWRD